MKKLYKLGYVVLAVGVLISAAFYVYETGGKSSSRNMVIFGDGDDEESPGEDIAEEAAAETFSESQLAAIDEIVRAALKDASENEIKAAVREEILAAGKAGYLELALDEARLLAEAEAEARKGMVNINTASAEELMTLQGIGEKRASDIIAYRESSGGFGDISEIMNVSGIKESSFEKIKDKIYV